MSDKMREEFEAWAKRHHGVYSIGSVCAHYSNENVQRDWIIWCLAWQASRAALVVELPTAFDAAVDDACNYEYAYLQSEVKEALGAAGVRYNG